MALLQYLVLSAMRRTEEGIASGCWRPLSYRLPFCDMRIVINMPVWHACWRTVLTDYTVCCLRSVGCEAEIVYLSACTFLQWKNA